MFLHMYSSPFLGHQQVLLLFHFYVYLQYLFYTCQFATFPRPTREYSRQLQNFHIVISEISFDQCKNIPVSSVASCDREICVGQIPRPCLIVMLSFMSQNVPSGSLRQLVAQGNGRPDGESEPEAGVSEGEPGVSKRPNFPQESSSPCLQKYSPSRNSICC